ncbi:hypothetical protein [Pseudomonas mediterranea]|uniref:hypothetical protein n=1 Tax=Pseudomonas mediterranea TaxID=183795 RepID=UPI0006D8C04E|nr:hypothetical protein [Pseudomonas mediterranea]
MDQKDKTKIWLWFAVVAALIVIACVAGEYISVFSAHVLSDQEKWGQFGDYFGGVLNPILSFFAFVALLITLRTQFLANEDGERRHNEQLKEQRLFQLIGLMNENALGTKMLNPAKQGGEFFDYLHGHQAQHHAAMNLRDSLSRRVSISSQVNGNDLEVFKSAEEVFKRWRRVHWSAVGIFVDSVFLALKFVLKEQSSDDFTQFSLSVIRVQLSESERLMVWYVAMFTAEYVIYLEALIRAGFIDDHEGSLDDQIKPWREKMISCSRLWSNFELERRSTKA